MVHFLGKTKPWSYTYNPKSKQISGNVSDATTHPSFLLDWWELYSSTVVPVLQEQFGDQPFHSGCVEVTERLSNFTLLTISIELVNSSCDTRKNCPGDGPKVLKTLRTFVSQRSNLP